MQFIIYDGPADLENTNWPGLLCVVIKTYSRIITLSRNLTVKRGTRPLPSVQPGTLLFSPPLNFSLVFPRFDSINRPTDVVFNVTKRELLVQIT